jgi:hypothetical protein
MDGLTRTVREQIALGRLLPLGSPQDGAWITESAAVRVMRRAAAAVPGVRLGAVSLVAVDRGGTAPALPQAAPVGAPARAPIRIEAAFEAAPDEPLPQVADRLRLALWAAAEDGLGISVAEVDLHVTGLLDAQATDRGPQDGGDPAAGRGGADRGARTAPDAEAWETDDAEAGEALVPDAPEEVAAAVRAVPGVLRLSSRLGGFGSGVRVQDTDGTQGVPGRRVQVQFEVAAGHVPLAVARRVAGAVRAAAEPGAPGPVDAAVVVTGVGG